MNSLAPRSDVIWMHGDCETGDGDHLRRSIGNPQAGSERSLTVGPEAMYEAEPFAAEAAENGLAEDAPEPSSKKMAHAESVGTEDRACMQAEGDVSVHVFR